MKPTIDEVREMGICAYAFWHDGKTAEIDWHRDDCIEWKQLEDIGWSKEEYKKAITAQWDVDQLIQQQKPLDAQMDYNLKRMWTKE